VLFSGRRGDVSLGECGAGGGAGGGCFSVAMLFGIISCVCGLTEKIKEIKLLVVAYIMGDATEKVSNTLSGRILLAVLLAY
jgi:hypothetical protein